MSVDDGQGRAFEAPGDAPEQAAVSYTGPGPQGPQSAVTATVERHRAELTKIAGVYGVAESRTAIGDPAIRIDIDNDSVRDRLPKEIEGLPVEVVVVPGGFEILPATE